MSLFLPDANVLIHALRKQSPQHEPCRNWLTQAASRGDQIGLTDLAEVALLRIPTLPKLNLAPISEVLGYWHDDLWTYPGTIRLTPGPGHQQRLAHIVTTLGLRGNDINDAWLAALAIGHRATLVSTDTGFRRFTKLDWLDPGSL